MTNYYQGSDDDLTEKVILRSVKIDKFSSDNMSQASDDSTEVKRDISKSFKSVQLEEKSSMPKNSSSSVRFNAKASKQYSKRTPNDQEEDSTQIDFINVENFIDPEFPRNKNSIFVANKAFDIKDLLMIQFSGFHKIFKWLRPHEIRVKKGETHHSISLFSNPSANDVVQGGVGSCWFISSLAALAERPELLLNTMSPQSYNPNGFHQVRLCIRGRWVIINIDDYLPCSLMKKLVFARSKRRQFYVPFIEKALAKFNGSYEAIASGATVEGLQTLTGEPCEVIYLENARLSLKGSAKNSFTVDSNPNSNPLMVWKKILLARQRGYLMTALCYNEKINIIEFQVVGLFSRHIYSVLDAREFEHNGKPINLLKLRNPWGKKEWRGAWSVNWPNWPEHIKQELLPSSSKDGSFWISFEHLLEYFYDLTVCKVRPDWLESRQSSYFYDFSQNCQIHLLTVTEPGVHHFEIELFATGTKYKIYDRNADPDIDLCLILCKVDDPVTGAGLKCVEFEHNVEYFITMSAALTRGYYFIFVTSFKAIRNINLVNKKQATSNSSHTLDPDLFTYNLVLHGLSSFKIKNTLMPKEFISQLFYQVAVKQDKVKYDLNNNYRSYVISGGCTHGYIIENLSSTHSIKISLDMEKSKNMESTRVETLTTDYLAPNTRQLIIFLTPTDYHRGYVIGYRVKSELVDHNDTSNVGVPSVGNYPFVPSFYSGLHAINQVDDEGETSSQL
jgi:calpain-15